MNEILIKKIKKRLKDNYDVKYREIEREEGIIYIIFIDNLSDSQFISEYIVAPIVERELEISDVETLKKEVLFANIIGDVEDEEDIYIHILSGDTVIISSNFEEIIFCESKSYTRRSVDIPITESVIKGPREGFTETFVDNVSLIRRKVKNPDLKFESFFIGEKSNTPVVISYINNLADEKLVSYVRSQIKTMDVNFILDTNYIEEKLRNKKTAFETIGYSEKPDIIASKLFEGRVAVLVDGTPFVITAPYFFLENFQMSDDYYLNKVMINIIRVLRYLSFFIALLLPGAYVAFTTYHFSFIPSVIAYRLAVSRAGVPFPTVIEVLLMMFFFQILREAGIRLPQPVGQAMSIIGALILGDAAVGAGLASQSTLVIIALSSIASFLTPKLYAPILVWQALIVIISALLGLPGFYMIFFMMLAHIAGLSSCGYPYLFPIGTSTNYKFKDLIFRSDLNKISKNIFKDE